MPEVRVLEDAAQELDEAAAHYEHEWPGLGSQFLDAVAEVLDVLGHDFAPTTAISAGLSKRGVRRLLMRRFPYAVIVRQRRAGWLKSWRSLMWLDALATGANDWAHNAPRKWLGHSRSEWSRPSGRDCYA